MNVVHFISLKKWAVTDLNNFAANELQGKNLIEHMRGKIKNATNLSCQSVDEFTEANKNLSRVTYQNIVSN